MADRRQIAQDCFHAFARGDREFVERTLSEDFAFSAPPDPALDRAGFFERCWPGAGSLTAFDFVRVVESGDDVIVTYEATRADGTRFRNTEVLGFAGERVRRQEVYFGWDL
jgi:ketosteroid isomerase-like protein